jgi:hypothetical protein
MNPPINIGIACFLTLGCLTLTARPARAVLPPSVYKMARDQAAYHIQVKVLKVEAPRRFPGRCLVTGKVATVFRDTKKTLKAGTTVTFHVSCRRKGDEIPMGGTLWTNYNGLKKARYLEGFLNAASKATYKLGVARDQIRIIHKPSKSPKFKPSL